MDEFIRRSKRPKLTLDKDAPKKSAQTVPPEVVPAKASEPKGLTAEPEPSATETPAGEPGDKPKSGGKFKFSVPTPKTKKQWIIAIAIMATLLAGAGTAVYWFIIRDTTPAPVVATEPEPEPTPPQPIISRTTGREVSSESINSRPAYAVQIENSPEARPQSGLKEADIVFEAIAEGGITRFNAIFHDNVPANIGPVRSLRPYFIDWFMPYDAAIVHAGGSPEALQNVRSLGLKDMDSVGSIMRRISQRYSPHNYYTTGQQVLDEMSRRGYSSTFTGLPRKTAAPSEAPNATTINLDVSSRLYNVSFKYDPTTNTYLRSQGGGAHVDAEGGGQLAPDVVVVPIIGRRTHSNRVHTVYDTVGAGAVYIFQDGAATVGTWHKSSQSAQWELKDSAGQPLALNPGQTWFTMIESASRVSYSP